MAVHRHLGNRLASYVTGPIATAFAPGIILTLTTFGPAQAERLGYDRDAALSLGKRRPGPSIAVPNENSIGLIE